MNEVSNFVNGNVPHPYDDNNFPVIKINFKYDEYSYNTLTC
jgi:hypothetical protein